MFLFPLIYLTAFVVSLREILFGRRDGIFIYIIFGLSIYNTALSVAFMLGLKSVMPLLQSFKEVLVLLVFTLNVVTLKRKPVFHVIDYLIIAFFAYTLIWALLPIGEQGLVNRLLAFKSTSFYIIVYFTGRLLDPKKVFISKYFNHIALLTIAAGAVLMVEIAMNQHLQISTGYAEYNYYFFNYEPDGSYGLSTTFESEGGYRRFASFFTNPLEHAVATVLALGILLSLYTGDDNKIKINSIGMLALGLSLLSILFALSRAPLVSYFVVIYIYALVAKKKFITRTAHIAVGGVALYLVYLFSRFEDVRSGLLTVVMNTVDFSNPSSVGHLVQWAEGILSIIEHPFGLGMGTSGRTAGAQGENIGGENQYIIIGVQAGIIAAGLFIAIYFMFIRLSIKWLKILTGHKRKLCMAVLLVKIGLFIPLFTSEVEGSGYISYLEWFLSGLLISVIMSYPEEETTLTPSYD